MYDPSERAFPQTTRAGTTASDLVPEGLSPRYTAIAALGIGQLDEPGQVALLGGKSTLTEVLERALSMGRAGTDPGALALALWAAAELPAGEATDSLATARNAALRQLLAVLGSNVPMPTVDLAWSLTALLATSRQAWPAWGGDGEEFPAQAVNAARTDAVHRFASRSRSG